MFSFLFLHSRLKKSIIKITHRSAKAQPRWKSRLDRLSFIGFPHRIKHSDASLINHSYRKLFVYLLLFLELPVHFSSSSAVSRTNTVQQASVVLLQFNGRPAMKRMLRVKSRIKAKVHYLALASYCSIPSSKEHIKTEAFNCTREKNYKLLIFHDDFKVLILDPCLSKSSHIRLPLISYHSQNVTKWNISSQRYFYLIRNFIIVGFNVTTMDPIQW